MIAIAHKYTWRVVSVLLLAGAALQHWYIHGRVAHTATICWKVGLDPPLITVTRTSVAMFAAISVAACFFALLAADRLYRCRSGFRFVALLAVCGWIAGVTVWSGLLATPFVRIHSYRHEPVAIDPSGRVTIVDNDGISNCDAQGFVDAIDGYTDIVTISGNDPC